MTYTAGLIGVGGVGAHHATGYRETEGIELIAVADLDEETLADRGEEWGIAPERRYADHAALLAAEDLDAVSVATPTPFHHDHTLDAVRSAADPDVVWCEKPIATGVSDAEAMVAACEEAGAELLVNHTRRWTDELRTLRRLVAEERVLGDLHSVTAQWPLELFRNGTHVVDLLYYVLDEEIDRVSGYLSGKEEITEQFGDHLDVDDSGGGGHFVTESGTLVTLNADIPREVSATTLQFVGSGGKMYLDLASGEWRFWEVQGRGDHVETELPAIADGWATSFGDFFPAIAANVVGVLDGEEEPASPGDEATEVLEILIALCVSHHTGSHVSLPLERPLRDVTIRGY